MQVYFTTTVDRARHRVPHCELLQSWVRRTDEDERILTSDLPSCVSKAHEADPDALARLEIPGAIGSNVDFANLFADMHTAMAEDVTLITDPPRDQQTSLGRTDMIEGQIASARPDWPGPVQQKILGLRVVTKKKQQKNKKTRTEFISPSKSRIAKDSSSL